MLPGVLFICVCTFVVGVLSPFVLLQNMATSTVSDLQTFVQEHPALNTLATLLSPHVPWITPMYIVGIAALLLLPTLCCVVQVLKCIKGCLCRCLCRCRKKEDVPDESGKVEPTVLV